MNENDMLNRVVEESGYSGWSELENTARQVILAAKIREESYVPNPEFDSGNSIVAGKYSKSMEQAAVEAGQQLGTSPASTWLVNILLSACWNDALAWATETATGWKA